MNIPHKDFERIFTIIYEGMSHSQILSVPGVLDLLIEDLNNEIIDHYIAEQEE